MELCKLFGTCLLYTSGCSEARIVKKQVSARDRLKAAELLGKRYGLYTEKVEPDMDMELKVKIDYGDDSS